MTLRFSAPMRLSLAGGGTDLPAAYRRSGAHLLAVAISTRVTVEIGLDVDHQPSPLCDLFRSFHPKYGVSVRSDVGPGSGLGGSGAVAAALVAASRYLTTGAMPPPLEVGLTAFRWESELLGEPVGFQDPVAAALGGCVEMTATPDGEITAHVRPDLVAGLESLLTRNFVIVESGLRRSASQLLERLATSYENDDLSLDVGPATVEDVQQAILAADGQKFGQLLRAHWASKCRRLPGASTPEIDLIIQTALAAGADGAKAIGAGGGGYVLMSGTVENRSQVVAALARMGCRIMDFSLEMEGVRNETK